MRLLASVPVQNGAVEVPIDVGSYGLFMIKYKGNALPGQTITRADLGDVQLVMNGEFDINVDADFLNRCSNLYGGFAKFSSTTGSAYDAVIFIPTGLWWDPANVYYVHDTDRTSFRLRFTSLSSKSASGKVELYAKFKYGAQRYKYRLFNRNVVSSGGGDVVDVIDVLGIANIYLKSTSIVDNVQIQKGRYLVDGSFDAVLNYSDWIHQLESSGDLIGIEFAESRDYREALVEGGVVAKYRFNASGTLEQYYGQVIRTPDREELSKAFAVMQMK